MPSFNEVVLTGSDWSAAATIQMAGGASGGGFFVVENAKVFYSLQFGIVSQGVWTDPYPLGVGTGQIPGGVTGIRFKNADATAPATVTAAIAPPNQPIVGLTTQGQVNATMITGIVNADGTIAGGTGFTVNHSGTGVYIISFNTAFAAAPIVLGNTQANGNPYILETSSVTASSARISLWNVGGATVDGPFNFMAQAIA